MMEQNRKDKVEIPGGKLVGFLWKSDDNPHTVQIFDGNEEVPEIELDASVNPFVVEGQLCDIGKKISYSIRYVDGQYWLSVYDVKKLNEEVGVKDIQEYKYIASFDNAPDRLCFKEYWRADAKDNEKLCLKEGDGEKEESLCLDFAPLCPAEFVFVGFEKRRLL